MICGRVVRGVRRRLRRRLCRLLVCASFRHIKRRGENFYHNGFSSSQKNKTLNHICVLLRLDLSFVSR